MATLIYLYDDNGPGKFGQLEVGGATQQALTATRTGVAVIDPQASYFRRGSAGPFLS